MEEEFAWDSELKECSSTPNFTSIVTSVIHAGMLGQKPQI